MNNVDTLMVKLLASVALADRCEVATGPDPELDQAIHTVQSLHVKDEGGPLGRVCYDANSRSTPVPCYTTSIDAAMTLVLSGWKRINIDPNGRANIRLGNDCAVSAATPALALCAAALRVRALMVSEYD